MTTDRILQISNDVSEGCVKATKAELVEVVRYWQARSEAWNSLHQKRMGELLKVVSAHIGTPHPE